MKTLNKKGMTLIEVVVAIAIFGIVMVTIFPAVLVLNLMNTYSFEKLDTTYIAQQEMEKIIFESRTKNINNLRTYLVDEMDYTFDNTIVTSFVYHKEFSNYTITVTFTQFEASNLYNLIVVVDSSTNDIEGERVQLETMIAPGGSS